MHLIHCNLLNITCPLLYVQIVVSYYLLNLFNLRIVPQRIIQPLLCFCCFLFFLYFYFYASISVSNQTIVLYLIRSTIPIIFSVISVSSMRSSPTSKISVKTNGSMFVSLYIRNSHRPSFLVYSSFL